MLSRKQFSQKTNKKTFQGTRVTAISTVARIAGVLTTGVGLVAGLVFVGIMVAARGSSTVVRDKMLHKA